MVGPISFEYTFAMYFATRLVLPTPVEWQEENWIPWVSLGIRCKTISDERQKEKQTSGRWHDNDKLVSEDFYDELDAVWSTSRFIAGVGSTGKSVPLPIAPKILTTLPPVPINHPPENNPLRPGWSFRSSLVQQLINHTGIDSQTSYRSCHKLKLFLSIQSFGKHKRLNFMTGMRNKFRSRFAHLSRVGLCWSDVKLQSSVFFPFLITEKRNRSDGDNACQAGKTFYDFLILSARSPGRERNLWHLVSPAVADCIK